MLTTQLPGFKDPVHGAQQTFRALLDALARPGILQTTASLTPPEGLKPSCAAACLTLLDLETTVWLQPGISESVRSWLLFHTGCRFTTEPQTADFAVINDVETMPRLDEFNWGTAEYPEASTSLLIQLPALQGTGSAVLQGPGILDTITIPAPLHTDFWRQWQEMTANYPLGLDAWCFAEQQVLGLPRTAHIAGR
ncbi:MAG: phosphonate C-P lyase system protein PhnH [Leptolyngbya sp. DLM2.Bin15]|nr:MAG: phosphonate C-P lyase system protein PhnH [Leptolyngbya sp. DLM2.Bin15]